MTEEEFDKAYFNDPMGAVSESLLDEIMPEALYFWAFLIGMFIGIICDFPTIWKWVIVVSCVTGMIAVLWLCVRRSGRQARVNET